MRSSCTKSRGKKGVIGSTQLIIGVQNNNFTGDTRGILSRLLLLKEAESCRGKKFVTCLRKDTQKVLKVVRYFLNLTRSYCCCYYISIAIVITIITSIIMIHMIVILCIIRRLIVMVNYVELLSFNQIGIDFLFTHQPIIFLFCCSECAGCGNSRKRRPEAPQKVDYCTETQTHIMRCQTLHINVILYVIKLLLLLLLYYVIIT